MPPLSLSGFSPATQIGTILYKIIRRSRGETIGTRIDRGIPLIMPPSFVRRLRNNTTQSDGTTVKLGAPFSRRLAARVPSSKLHITLISALQIGQH